MSLHLAAALDGPLAGSFGLVVNWDGNRFPEEARWGPDGGRYLYRFAAVSIGTPSKPEYHFVRDLRDDG